MSWYAKIAWQEGLFLRPQLFQQQERYLERYAHLRAAPITPFFFGFTQYSIDHEALALGKVIIKSASGIFPDGTPFETPSNTILPLPLTIRKLCWHSQSDFRMVRKPPSTMRRSHSLAFASSKPSSETLTPWLWLQSSYSSPACD